MNASRLLLIGAVLSLFWTIGTDNANAWQRRVRIGAGLSRWDRPVHLPSRPIHHPINRVLPWYGPGFYDGSFSTWPVYDPLRRWDSPYWDGQPRDINININPPRQETRPAPPRREPKPRTKPRVIEWNAATGRAEDVDIGRWDKKAPSTPPDSTSTKPNASSGTKSLSRWDAPRSK